MPPRRPAILSIAGFDPTGGAGIITDAAVFRALGFHPLTVLTSVAAQGGSTLRQIRALPLGFMLDELNIIVEEFQPLAVKIGMLQNEAAVTTCAKFIENQKLPVVLDPVLWASSGKRLIRPSALPNLNLRLIPLCRLVTPNLLEAQTFLRLPVKTLSEAEEAAQSLSWRWKTWVLLKGGHLPGAPVDILADRDQLRHYAHPRIAEGMNLRGTGCALSAAAAVGLALGKTAPNAVEFAEDFVQSAIENHYGAAKDPGVGFLGF